MDQVGLIPPPRTDMSFIEVVGNISQIKQNIIKMTTYKEDDPIQHLYIKQENQNTKTTSRSNDTK